MVGRALGTSFPEDDITSLPVQESNGLGRIVIFHNTTGISGGTSFQYRLFDGFAFSNTVDVIVVVQGTNTHIHTHTPVPVSLSILDGVEDHMTLVDIGSTDIEGNEVYTVILALPKHGKLFSAIDACIWISFFFS